MVDIDIVLTTPNIRSHNTACDKHVYNVTNNDTNHEGDDWASTQRTPGTLTQSTTEKPYGVNDLRMPTSHRHQGGLQVTLQPWVTDVMVSKPYTIRAIYCIMSRVMKVNGDTPQVWHTYITTD